VSYLRLRQVCLVAPQRDVAECAITDVLGLAVCYRDPNVAPYGLENALWPVGDMFIEIVAPMQAETAAGRFLARSGRRGGYMVIFDCDDPERRAAHARAMGVRVVTEVAHDAYTGVQLHPRDCRAAMIEFNRTEGGDVTPELYAPAGPHWRRFVRGDATRRIRAIEIATPDPAGLAAHWGAIVERLVTSGAKGPELGFDEATIAFVPSDDGGERLSALVIDVADADAMMARAKLSGLAPTARGFIASGVEWVAWS
jgi:hypothetical protein